MSTRDMELHEEGPYAERVELELEYFERVEVSAGLTLVRLGGRWSGLEADKLQSPTLILERDGVALRLHALPEADQNGASGDDDRSPWRAAFATPAELALDDATRWGIHAGPHVALPPPFERRLATTRHEASYEGQTAPVPPISPLALRRLVLALIAACVMFLLALVVVTTVAS
jgi:hypothetical protein